MESLNEKLFNLFLIPHFHQPQPLCFALCNEDDYESFAQDLQKEVNILREVVEFIKFEYEKRLRQTVVPQFWNLFDKCSHDFVTFENAIKLLSQYFKECKHLLHLLQLIDPCATKSPCMMVTLKATLLSQISTNFNEAVYNYYSKAFKCYSSELKLVK